MKNQLSVIFTKLKSSIYSVNSAKYSQKMSEITPEMLNRFQKRVIYLEMSDGLPNFAITTIRTITHIHYSQSDIENDNGDLSFCEAEDGMIMLSYLNMCNYEQIFSHPS